MPKTRDKLIKALKSKSGASMMFVMGIMLTLMFISISVLVAASAAVGAGLNKHVNNQLELYADGVHKAVMSSLQACDSDEGCDVDTDMPGTLGGQLLRSMYREAMIASNTSVPYEIDTIKIDGDVFPDARYSASTTSIGIEPYVLITNNNAMIGARVEVTVTIEGPRNRGNVSVAVYNYIGGYLEDGVIIDAGEWKFISYEKTNFQT